MKYYLEHHRGQGSNNVVIYAMLNVPPADAWAKLMGPQGFVAEGSLDNLTVGATFRFTTSRGDLFEGSVRKYVPGKTFAASVESLNKSILRTEMATMPGHGRFLYISLSTWGLPKADVDALGARLKAIVYGLFPQKTDAPASSCSVPASEPSAAGKN